MQRDTCGVQHIGDRGYRLDGRDLVVGMLQAGQRRARWGSETRRVDPAESVHADRVDRAAGVFVPSGGVQNAGVFNGTDQHPRP